jgi:hypothetical protein
MHDLYSTCYEFYIDVREGCCKAARAEPGWRNLAVVFVASYTPTHTTREEGCSITDRRYFDVRERRSRSLSVKKQKICERSL